MGSTSAICSLHLREEGVLGVTGVLSDAHSLFLWWLMVQYVTVGLERYILHSST